MTREEAYEYWRFKYEMAKDFDDPRWEGGEIREIRRYVDAIATILKMLEPPTSNADRIRAMTDEELAFWMTTNVTCCSCPVDLDACHNFEISGLSCEEILLDWLKAPVEVQDGKG